MKMIFSALLVLGWMAAPVAQAEIKWDAFFDVQYQWASGEGFSQKKNAFLLNDGALYLSHEVMGGEAKVDLPFSGGQTGNDFQFATTKAQAFYEKRYTSGIQWRLGQFDSLFSFEAKDTLDIPFSHKGLISLANPSTTHLGLMAGYVWGGFQFNLLASNPDNSGTRASGQMEYGFQFVGDMSLVRLMFGYLHNETLSGKRTITHAQAGTTVENWDIDFTWSQYKTPAAVKYGSGYLLQVLHECSDELGMGVRGELTNDLNSKHSQTKVTFGPQYQYNENVQFKLDYSILSTKQNDGDAAVSGGLLAFDMIYEF